MSQPSIHRADSELTHAWRSRFRSLPPSARLTLRQALLDLRKDALHRAELQWRRTCKHGLGTVTVAETDYKLVDIGMRMRTPHELFRAQGFPDRYVIAPHYNGRPLTQTAQIRMSGNSVYPDSAETLVRPNIPILATQQPPSPASATR